MWPYVQLQEWQIEGSPWGGGEPLSPPGWHHDCGDDGNDDDGGGNGDDDDADDVNDDDDDDDDDNEDLVEDRLCIVWAQLLHLAPVGKSNCRHNLLNLGNNFYHDHHAHHPHHHGYY